MTFDTLYHKGKAGAVFSWSVWTDGDTIFTKYGQLTGAKQVSSKRASPKNVGRANATTAVEQAEVEAKAMWTFKLERKYSRTAEEAQEPLLLPMLAHKYRDHAQKVVFPCDVQPKLDGVRCLAVNDGGKVTLLSRSGKTYNVAHLAKALESLLPSDSIADGEIYIHGDTLQHINSLVKRTQTDSVLLEYHVYDMPRWKGTEDEPWGDRRKHISEFFRVGDLKIVPVQTVSVTNPEAIVSLQHEFVEDGYEGAIVRNLSGLYLFGYRSHDLLKVKSFQDDEFEVIGAHCGVGKFAEAVVWECVTKDGVKFSATPKGTMEMRRQWLKDANQYIGKLLTVRFFNYTPDRTPFHGVGVAFRLKEDL